MGGVEGERASQEREGELVTLSSRYGAEPS